MERIRTLPLKSISQRQAALIRQGQMEAARVWTACRDLYLQALREGKPWPGSSEFHQATKGGRFALHSQTIQQVFRVFDAAVQAVRETRRNGRAEIRYPYRDKRFFPPLWPAQAMGLEDTRIVLPMGRGRPSLVFRRPEWLQEKCPCKVVWNGVHHELHVTVNETAPAAPTATERAAIATSLEGGIGGARSAAFEATGMWSARSTCTRRRLVRGCRF